MFCTECGKPIPESNYFCPFCGLPVDMSIQAGKVEVAKAASNIDFPQVFSQTPAEPVAPAAAPVAPETQVAQPAPAAPEAPAATEAPVVPAAPVAAETPVVPAEPAAQPVIQPAPAAPAAPMVNTAPADPGAAPQKKSKIWIPIVIAAASLVVIGLLVWGIVAGVRKFGPQGQAESLVVKAEECVKAGDYDEAENYYADAIKLYSGDPQVYKHYAELLLDRGDEQKAEEVLKEGIEKTDARSLKRLLERVQEGDYSIESSVVTDMTTEDTEPTDDGRITDPDDQIETTTEETTPAETTTEDTTAATTAETTEATETTATETTTAASTDETSTTKATETTAPSDGSSDPSGDPAFKQKMYDAYYKYLTKNKKNFLYYKYMDIPYYNSVSGEWEEISCEEGNYPHLSLIDLTGDGVDELVCIAGRDEYQFDLTIWGFANDKMNKLLTIESIDILAGGYSSYVIATTSNPGEILVYLGRFDELAFEDYLTYKWDGKVFAKQSGAFGVEQDMNDSGDKITTTYKKDGKKISKDDFDKLVAGYEAQASGLIIFNHGLDEGFTKVYLKTGSAMSSGYYTMCKTVKKNLDYWTGVVEGNAVDSKKFFKEAAGSMFMSSGAGAWESDITLKEDGTFEFSFHDANAGESGNGYDGTTYISTGKGKFSAAVKVSEYTYLVRVTGLEYDVAPGTTNIEDQGGYNLRYYYSDFYGFDKGSWVEIYMPGQPTKDLDEEFLGWTHWQYNHKTLPKSLNCVCLYCAETGCGFVAEDL